MKKLTFLIYHKEYDEFLKKLRDLGVVHVVKKQEGVADDDAIKQKLASIARTTQLIDKLKAHLGDEKIVEAKAPSAERGAMALEQYDALVEKLDSLKHQQQAYSKEHEMLEPWGDFDSSRIDELKSAGFNLQFYSCSENNFNEEWVDQFNAIRVNKINSKLFFVTVTKNDVVVDCEAELVKLPEYSLSHLEKLIAENSKALVDNESAFKTLAKNDMQHIEAHLKEVQNDMELSSVILSTEQLADNQLMVLEGWIPIELEEKAVSSLNKTSAYYEIVNPVPDDDVPIKFNNKKWFASFEPICKLYMLPKYNELDLTPFFGPFFMIFFGLCLGDSGYGLFLFLAATIYQLLAKQLTASTKSIILLVQLLGGAAFFCGLLTGTFFGVDLYSLKVGFLQDLKEKVFLDNNQMFQLSLILGGVQIMFGMVLKAVNRAIQFGIKYALSTIGWIVFLLSIIFAYLAPTVMPMFGTAHLVVLGFASIFIYFYNTPGKNIFLNFGLGLWDTYNMATGLLGDILSYIRLFALGLSGGILASVFNSLAVGMSPDNVIAGPIVMVLIFVIGHAINIFMSVLGAMVHPMRLTFVEFFKNSGYEGGGKEYQPFKLNK